jgi:hypothetical protein
MSCSSYQVGLSLLITKLCCTRSPAKGLMPIAGFEKIR